MNKNKVFEHRLKALQEMEDAARRQHLKENSRHVNVLIFSLMKELSLSLMHL